MGTKGIEIVGKSVDQLLEMLNKAFADEWLAYYQYWVGAKVVKGPMRQAAVAELVENDSEELGHDEMLDERLIKLGGTPLLKQADWSKMKNCRSEQPDHP